MIGSLALFAALVAAAPVRPELAQPPPAGDGHSWRQFQSPVRPRGLDLFAAREADDQEAADEDERDAGQSERARELQRQRDEQRRARDEERRARDEERRARDEARREQDRERRERDRERRAAERERFRSQFHEDEGESDDEPKARVAGKNGAASLAVKGPVTFRLRVQSGEVEMVATDKQQIALSVDGVPAAGDVQIVQYKDRFEAEFGGRHQLRRGHLKVELPKGSNVDFGSTSGDLSVRGVGGDVRVRTMSGDVKIEGVRNADVESISGDVALNATGPRLILHVVSGNALVTTADPSVQLAFQSASGSLDWTGVCAKGCHLTTETVSGDIKLQPDASKSSFELSYASHSGDLRDELKLAVKRAPKRKPGGMGGWLEAVYGKGEGVIECDAFSGDLIVRKK